MFFICCVSFHYVVILVLLDKISFYLCYIDFWSNRKWTIKLLQHGSNVYLFFFMYFSVLRNISATLTTLPHPLRKRSRTFNKFKIALLFSAGNKTWIQFKGEAFDISSITHEIRILGDGVEEHLMGLLTPNQFCSISPFSFPRCLSFDNSSLWSLFYTINWIPITSPT